MILAFYHVLNVKLLYELSRVSLSLWVQVRMAGTWTELVHDGSIVVQVLLGHASLC